MVQISKINTVNNQNLSFENAMMAKEAKKAQKEASKILCQYMSLPGCLDYVRVIERFPNGASRAATVPSDFFVKHLGQNRPKDIRAFLTTIHNAPSKDISNTIL